MSGPPPKTLNDVPGWLTATDRLLLEWILTWQSDTSEPGDVVELGVYQGKSAIHIASHMRPGERLTVCDLFDDAGNEMTIKANARKTYRTLTQRSFEENFLAFHTELPTVLRGMSSIIEDHVEPDSCRLVHIDASHMYEHVRGDTRAAHNLLREDGVVVFDDYRTEHTLGTAAAVWEAVVNDGLHPICASSMKFYGTWGDPEPMRNEILDRIAQRTDMYADLHHVQRDELLIRVATVKKPAPAPDLTKDSKAVLAQAETVLQQVTAMTRPNQKNNARRSPLRRAASRAGRSARAFVANSRRTPSASTDAPTT